MAAYLVMLREGVEAALIVAILLAYLRRSGVIRPRRWVWAGTLLAVAVSVVAGAVIWVTIGGLEGAAEQLAEGIIAVAAVALLTWMIFWMGSRARTLRAELETDAGRALAESSMLGLAAVAFVAVLREGLESALFMISLTAGSESGLQLLGGLLGLASAVVIGWLVYQGGSRINLRLFFQITGVLIVFVAAGLVGKAVHEFQEVGLLPVLVEHVWTIRFLDPEVGLIGAFAKTLFGLSHSPSLLQVASYWAYLVPVTFAFLTKVGRSPRKAAALERA